MPSRRLVFTATRKLTGAREILFLTVAPAFYLMVAMSSKVNIGVRHILLLYVFLAVLIAGAVWRLIAPRPSYDRPALAMRRGGAYGRTPTFGKSIRKTRYVKIGMPAINLVSEIHRL
jgi:hypothetical protein